MGVNTEGSERVSLQVPADLSEWFSRDRLVRWIREETEEIGLARAELPIPPRSECTGFRVPLRVLLLAYSAQLFANDTIVRACREEHHFRELAEGRVPFSEELEDFRRHNHPLLQKVLARVYWRAICERCAQKHLPPPAPIPWSSLREMAEELIGVGAKMETWSD